MNNSNNNTTSNNSNNTIVGDIPVRDCLSAPPVLELPSESLFAFNENQYATLFSDIRTNPDYQMFYENYQKGELLPPPLESVPFVFDSTKYPNFSTFGTTPPQQRDPTKSGANLNPNSNANNNNNANNNSNNKTGWTAPVPQRKANMKDFDLRSSNDTKSTDQNMARRILSNDFDLLVGSPSAQIALGTANFIWSDEDSPSFSRRDHSKNEIIKKEEQHPKPKPTTIEQQQQQSPQQNQNQQQKSTESTTTTKFR